MVPPLTTTAAPPPTLLDTTTPLPAADAPTDPERTAPTDEGEEKAEFYTPPSAALSRTASKVETTADLDKKAVSAGQVAPKRTGRRRALIYTTVAATLVALCVLGWFFLNSGDVPEWLALAYKDPVGAIGYTPSTEADL